MEQLKDRMMIAARKTGKLAIDALRRGGLSPVGNRAGNLLLLISP